MMLAALLVAQAGPLPPYTDSIRCAGLAEAADQLESDETRSRQLYDAALFWGLAASERARKDGVSATRFTADQAKARAVAFRDLAGARPEPMRELLDCLARVPAR